MLKRLIGTAVTAAVAALSVKVIKDVLDADEEMKLIELETEEEPVQEESVEE